MKSVRMAKRQIVRRGVAAALVVFAGALAGNGGGALAAAPPPPALYPQATNAVPGQPNISGIWSVREFALSRQPSAERKIKTIDGQLPPLQPWAQEIYDQRARDSDAGTPFANSAARCLPNGMPLQMYSAPAYGTQIIQSPGQVTILHEEPGVFRIIRLDEDHPPDDEIFPSFGGHSVGRFEGDTLVVDTIKISTEATIDTLGMPHTEQLRVTERIRRIAPDVLEIIFTVDDPGTFLKPWQFRRTYALWPPGRQIAEYVCLENQRNSPDDTGRSKFGE